MPIDNHANTAPALQVRLQQSSPIALDVSLQCQSGELLALTGPSGSGKTTVLRAIAGLQHIDNGYVRCNGSTWWESSSNINTSVQQRRVGLVFQQFALFPHMNALENVSAAMSDLPRSSHQQQAKELLALTNMQGLEQRKPHQLSGGQKQRVALARALARRPDVLLLDEPFSAVDQQTRNKLYRELAQLRRTLALPMVLVTHDMREVEQLADSLCLIHHGKTLQSGKVNDVISKPDSAAIARLVGHHNLFDAALDSGEHGCTINLHGCALSLEASPALPAGRVSVLIEPSAIIMHRQDRPSRGERENPLTATVAETVVLGDEMSVKLALPNTSNTLGFHLSKHVAARNGVCAGATLSVSILREGIHVMPPHETGNG